MSSLAAAKADNFRYPPDFDPKRHGTLNKYHGQHALRDRARRLESDGILVVRFEVPFNMWCAKCGEHVAKGVRFNADKKAVGAYHSTKVWSFAMRHHCGSRIVIETDPKNAEYVVKEGARRKVEAYDAADAETLALPSAEERHAVASDPLASLERATLQQRAAAGARARLEALAADRDNKRDGYALNKQLRAALRASKKEDAALDARRAAIGLPESVPLLPESRADAREAALTLFAADDGAKYEDGWRAKRRRIMGESIMAAASSGGGGGGGGRGASGSGSGSGRGSGAVVARGSGSGGGGGKQQPKLSAAAQALAARLKPGAKLKGFS